MDEWIIENLFAPNSERIKAFYLSFVIMIIGIIWWILDKKKK